MTYRSGVLPPDAPAWAVAEFRRLEQAQTQSVASITLKTLFAVPAKPKAGMCVMADGTTWNPGSGAGVYVYRGSAWHFLG